MFQQKTIARINEYSNLVNKNQLKDLKCHPVICNANQMLIRFAKKQDQDKICYKDQCRYHQYQFYTRKLKNPSTFTGDQDIAQLAQQNYIAEALVFWVIFKFKILKHSDIFINVVFPLTSEHQKTCFHKMEEWRWYTCINTTFFSLQK